MSREEILGMFNKLRYCVLWPGEWKDIGFTERPIWINSYCYGYICDDEPCMFAKIVVKPDVVKTIKQKACGGELTINDILSTSFSTLLEWIHYDDVEANLEFYMDIFSKLPDNSTDAVFVGEDDDGFKFFSTELDLINAFEKTTKETCGECWEDLDDDMLNEWYNRIFVEKQEFELPLSLSITI